MPFVPANHLAKMTSSIFTELVLAKRAALASGKNLIDLSIGSPDLPPPKVVVNRLRAEIDSPDAYGYTITGIPSFSEAVHSFYQRRYGVALTAESEVIQLMGSQDGLSHLAMAMLNPGDVVLSPDPGYTVYESAISLSGGTLFPMPLLAENQFLPDLSSIPEDVAQKAKMMILNFPGNPVPALAPFAFFEEVVAFARKYDILVVHDFAYSELVFDGYKPVSFLSVPGAKEVGVEFNSLSKAFNMAGCRIGYMAGNAEVVRILGQFKSHVDFGIFLPIQRAAITALTSSEAEASLQEQVELYESRRSALCEGLNAVGWHVDKPPATMFVWARIPDGWKSREFAFAALEHANVVMTPGNAFGRNGEGYVRIALVQSAERLSEAANRIGAFLNHHAPVRV